MTTLVVSGALANRPGNGGGASVRTTWVEGLRRLGFDVWFVEQIARSLLAGADGSPAAPARSPRVRFFDSVTRQAGLAGRSALLDEDGAVVTGVDRAMLDDAAAEAVLLVNLGGHLTLPALRARFRRAAFVDLDPGFTQFWHAAGLSGAGLAGHDAFFTVGMNVGRPDCGVPTDGIAWRPLPPPVLVDEWSPRDSGLDAFTTVASWRGTFGPVEHGGRSFGLKVHEFRKFIDLPAHVPAPLEIALDIDPADGGDLAALRQHGWRVVDPRQVAADPAKYRDYIASSGAELSVAQGIYVETASGWVSDRTVRYLAAGRPALVQDTGLAARLPVGEGLLAFRSRAEAVAGVRAIVRDYPRHRARARELAREHFDAGQVLTRFVEQAGVAP